MFIENLSVILILRVFFACPEGRQQWMKKNK
jgi:hypothetical protein